ncbi:hypothetical protein G7Y79_00012g033180 [Physcia stellaris]|nr:hypothetical protein G7Y79_00012g033180 [Physcia stellaris]
MGKLQQSILNTLKQGASPSRREDSKGQVPLPKTEKKTVPPVQKRPISPPPAYTSQAPGVMPAAPSKETGRQEKPLYNPWAALKEAEASSSRRDGDRGRKSRDDDVGRYGQPSPRRNRNPSEHSRDRGKGKGKEAARRKKSRRDVSDSESASESESDSEQERKRRNKSKKSKGREEKALVRREDVKKDKKGKSKKKYESESEDDSDAEIVETRKRYEAITNHELEVECAEALMDIFQVNDSRIEKWCDQELIRLDTKTGYYNIDKLVKSGKVEPDDVKKWAIFEKKFKRGLEAEGCESGVMSSIPRFRKYTKAAEPDYYAERSGPRIRGGYPAYHEDCVDCSFDERYCGDRYHRDFQ